MFLKIFSVSASLVHYMYMCTHTSTHLLLYMYVEFFPHATDLLYYFHKLYLCVCSPRICMLLNDEAEFNKLYYVYIYGTFYTKMGLVDFHFIT